MRIFLQRTDRSSEKKDSSELSGFSGGKAKNI